MDDNINRKIINIISGYTGIAKEEILLEANLVEDLHISRIEIPEIFLLIENELHLQLPQDKIQEITTVEQLINLANDNVI